MRLVERIPSGPSARPGCRRLGIRREPRQPHVPSASEAACGTLATTVTNRRARLPHNLLLPEVSFVLLLSVLRIALLRKKAKKTPEFLETTMMASRATHNRGAMKWTLLLLLVGMPTGADAYSWLTPAPRRVQGHTLTRRPPALSMATPSSQVESFSTATTKGLVSDRIDIEQLQRPDEVYQRGLVTVAFITLLFASNSPAIHAAFSRVSQVPPVLLLNAAVSTIALAGVTLGGPLLDKVIPEPSLLDEASTKDDDDDDPRILAPTVQAGLELGLWKFLGTTANLYGLSQTSADHGAFLIQLTTLFVPAAQGLMGVPIPTRIWTAIGLALTGVFVFTQDPASVGSWQGDASCIVAAVFYATYDLRLFQWGQKVAPLELITNKVATQAGLSCALLAALGWTETVEFLQSMSVHDATMVATVALWSGLIVNGIVPYLQVGGQQAVGPARAQILYASQPLWAALMSFAFLGEMVGPRGYAGGAAFLTAMMLAATSQPEEETSSTADEA